MQDYYKIRNLSNGLKLHYSFDKQGNAKNLLDDSANGFGGTGVTSETAYGSIFEFDSKTLAGGVINVTGDNDFVQGPFGNDTGIRVWSTSLAAGQYYYNLPDTVAIGDTFYIWVKGWARLGIYDWGGGGWLDMDYTDMTTGETKNYPSDGSLLMNLLFNSNLEMDEWKLIKMTAKEASVGTPRLYGMDKNNTTQGVANAGMFALATRGFGWAKGNHGRALVGGGNTYWDISKHTSFLDGAENFSISFWIKPLEVPFPDIRWEGIFSSGNQGTGHRQLWLYPDRNDNWLNINTDHEDGTRSAPDVFGITANEWQKIDITWSMSEGKIRTYRNNVLSDEQDTTNSPLITDTDEVAYFFFMQAYGELSDIEIDDFRIYNRVLADEERTLLYNSTYSLEDGLLYYANFNEGDDANGIIDYSKYANHATAITGSPTYVTTGKYNSFGMQFDRANPDYADALTNARYALVTQHQHTICAWGYPTIIPIPGAESSGFFMTLNGGVILRFDYQDRASAYWYDESLGYFSSIYQSGILANNWNFVLAERDYETLRLYVNGVLAGVITGYTVSLTASSYPRIGAQTSSLAFSGILDECRMYNRVLSDNEKTALLSYNPYNQIATPIDLIIDRQFPTVTHLTWTKVPDSRKTMVRYNVGAYPTDENDGILAYFGTAEECKVSGLLAGVQYFFKAWGWGYEGGSDYFDVQAGLYP